MLCVFSLGHRVGSQHAPASKCCRYISRPVGQGINTMTESLFQRAGKKTKREDDQKGAADRSFRFHKTNPRKRSRGSREDSLFQSERQDCFSVTDEKLFFFHRGIATQVRQWQTWQREMTIMKESWYRIPIQAAAGWATGKQLSAACSFIPSSSHMQIIK